MKRAPKHLSLHRETLASLAPGGPAIAVHPSMTSSPSWICVPCMPSDIYCPG